MSEKKTRPVSLLAGSTAEAPAGEASSKVMKSGEESPDILLALFNSTLETMLANKTARIVGTINTVGADKKAVPTTIIFVYGAVPTANGTLKSA